MDLRAGAEWALSAGANGILGHRLLLSRRNTKPGVVASVPCALAVGDAEQADILQKPRSTALAIISTDIVDREKIVLLRGSQVAGFTDTKSGIRRRVRAIYSRMKVKRRSECDVVNEPAHDQQARHDTNAITKNVDPRHHSHPSLFERSSPLRSQRINHQRG